MLQYGAMNLRPKEWYEKRSLYYKDSVLRAALLSPVWYLSLGIALLGALSVAAWIYHWREFLQFKSDFAPIQFNSALCFIFCGLALIFVRARWLLFVCLFASLVILISGLSITEFLFNTKPWIGEIFFESYILVKTRAPGQLSPNVSLGLFLSGLVIFINYIGFNLRYLYPSLTMIGVFIFSIGAAGLFGYALEVESAYGWGFATRMSLLESFGIATLGLAIALSTWEDFHFERYSLRQMWRVITLYATSAVLVVGIVSAAFAVFPLYDEIYDLSELILKEETKSRAERFGDIVEVSEEENLPELPKGTLGEKIAGILNEKTLSGARFIVSEIVDGKRTYYRPKKGGGSLWFYEPSRAVKALVQEREASKASGIVEPNFSSKNPSYVTYATIPGTNLELYGVSPVKTLLEKLNASIIQFVSISIAIALFGSLGVFLLVKRLVSDGENIQTQVDKTRNEKEEYIKSSLKEKETMLQEIHHRVKNNLQVISSLLRLQARTIDDEKGKAVFQESQNRVRAIALLHQLLYQSKNFAAVDFQSFLDELCSKLLQSYGFGDKIQIIVEAEGISLPLDQAVPCGLLVNELVTNSLKHGFKGRKSGDITIVIENDDIGGYTAVVKDNGKGFTISKERPRSLGLRLIKQLTQQLGGKIEQVSENGVRTTFSFPKKSEGSSDGEVYDET